MMGAFLERKKIIGSKHFRRLSKKLEKRRSLVLSELTEKHKEAVDWAKKKGIKPQELAQKSARGLATGIATGAMVFSAGIAPNAELPNKKATDKEISREKEGPIETGIRARKDITGEVRKALLGANSFNEKELEKRLSDLLKIPVKAEIDGIRLNTYYGTMGYESHLTRYPGDNLGSHFHSQVEYSRYANAGMAGGHGAWGYIASSREAMSAKDVEREKYYLVAQTFLSPNWGSPSVKKWFRHRKMVVVNPANGRVAVGVLEDAGPEVSTGRQFGGSPEIYEELDLRKTSPHVLMFFIEDPKDKIPLGRYGI
ncbi:MAG: hypothetical protein WD187_02895 [Candidatus Woykebacteria bacterium]